MFMSFLILRRTVRRMEVVMKRMVLTLVASLALLLTTTPSWGQPVCAVPGCNPTVTDATGNTAGGSDTLLFVDSMGAGGAENTAFGFGALQLDTTGSSNTGVGWQALVNNSSGFGNTATGAAALVANTTGGNNTATGASALAANNGNNNTA